MRAKWSVAALLCGCYHFNADDPCAISCTTTCPSGLTCGADGLCHGASGSCPAQDGGGGDTGNTGSACYGTLFAKVCFDSVPTGAVTLPSSFDTGGSACQATRDQGPEQPELCVFAGSTASIDATVRATGTRALVVIATDAIEIGSAGVVDVGSHRNTAIPSTGAADDDASCGSATPAQVGSAGGAGGSFAGKGGKGGGVNGTGGGAGGTAADGATATYLRGGCPGQPAGGDATSLGDGGGAVWLIAGSSIDVHGAIDASGAAAAAASGTGAGGGAGAGGTIALEAATVTLEPTAMVSAIGGGGGGGGGGVGKDGSNPTMCASSGGPPASGDGRGGTASCGSVTGGAAGTGNVAGNFGGGGGGAAGYILVRGQSVMLGSDVGSAASIQPAPTQM